VLPVSEQGSDNCSEKLYDDKDVRIEVMRARGAGGQVGILFSLKA
jgi:protein subunit release factor A